MCIVCVVCLRVFRCVRVVSVFVQEYENAHTCVLSLYVHVLLLVLKVTNALNLDLQETQHSVRVLVDGAGQERNLLSSLCA